MTVLVFAGGVGAVPACACPVCDSDTGREVRGELLGRDLGLNLLATVLPFAAVAGVVAAVHLGLSRPAKRRTNGHPRP